MEGSSAVPMPRGYRQPRCGRGDGGGIRGCYFERQRCECEYEKRMNGTAPPTATTATAAAGTRVAAAAAAWPTGEREVGDVWVNKRGRRRVREEVVVC